MNKLVPNLLEDTGRGDSVAIQEQQLRCHSHGLTWFLCVSACLHLCVSKHVLLCACVYPILSMSIDSLSVCPCTRWLQAIEERNDRRKDGEETHPYEMPHLFDQRNR